MSHPHKHSCLLHMCKIAYIDIFNLRLTLLPCLLTFSMSFKLRRNIFGTVLSLCDVCFTARHRYAASEVQRVHMRAFTEGGGSLHQLLSKSCLLSFPLTTISPIAALGTTSSASFCASLLFQEQQRHVTELLFPNCGSSIGHNALLEAHCVSNRTPGAVCW